VTSPAQFKPAPRNRLLAALPPEDLARLWPRLEPVELRLRQVLHPPETPITEIYFPETGWVSMIILFEDGDSAEVGMIGHEGMVGLPVLLRSDRYDLEAMVQAPGTALRLSSAAFREEFDGNRAFRDLMLNYALAHYNHVARTAACNSSHHIEQRLARFLLLVHDLVDGDTYPMTHEFLSVLLGIRRAGVTAAAGAMQKAGLIRYGAGRITIADRLGLENATCECYDATRRALDRVFGRDRPDAGKA
jgi:CRP-like cAMP-binding protein